MSSAVNRHWGHGWRVETRASRARHGDVGGDPQYVGDCMTATDDLGSVDCDEDHGWDAYGHVDHGYSPGKLTGPDGADEEDKNLFFRSRCGVISTSSAKWRSAGRSVCHRCAPTATPIGSAEAAALSSPEALDGVGAG
jgi:hypothetical protein